MPAQTGAAAFIALVGATVRTFPLEGGTNTDEDSLAFVKYKLTFTLLPVTLVRESLVASVELAASERQVVSASGLYPIAPTRIVDTRAAPDRVGPFARVGAGQSIAVPIVGQAGVPEGAVAAVINATAAGQFVPVEPCRALDTRPTPDRRGDVAGPVQAGASVPVTLAARCGLPGAASIGSVVLNVTVVNPTENGYLTLWTDGEAQPPTSTVNFAAGHVVANHTIVYTSAAGAISAYQSSGSADVIIDVFGYYTA